MNYKEKHYWTQLQGQAGVWTVAAQLALRGHAPMFASVDYGYDLMLDNGLRIQVKAARLSANVGKLRNRYPGGVYHFNLRCANRDANGKLKCMNRDYSKVADFFVFWGIDENRFWILPTKGHAGAYFMCSRSPLHQSGYHKIKVRNAEWEDNWNALNVESTAEKLIESVGSIQTTQEQN
jgi:hypothetical protein